MVEGVNCEVIMSVLKKQIGIVLNMISQLNCFTTNIFSCDLNSWSTMNSIGTNKKLKSAGWIELYTRFLHDYICSSRKSTYIFK